ncbi:hypothetical protein GOP47_0028014 [Adiantum capillus-veneris]|nr:hypothetical protein GOP47_0028014 [Adiantum capillus-veneris]
MLGRKKRRIAHGTEASDMVIDLDEKPQEALYSSIFTKMQSKWSKIIDIPGAFHTGRKREASRRVLTRRLPGGVKLRARMLLKKVKDKCGRFFSSKRRKNADGLSTEKDHYAAQQPTESALGRGWTFQRSPSNKPHHQRLHRNDHDYKHYPYCHYPIFPSLADADAIAECIEFIKRSSSTSSSSSSSSSSKTSLTSSFMLMQS